MEVQMKWMVRVVELATGKVVSQRAATSGRAADLMVSGWQHHFADNLYRVEKVSQGQQSERKRLADYEAYDLELDNRIASTTGYSRGNEQALLRESQLRAGRIHLVRDDAANRAGAPTMNPTTIMKQVDEVEQYWLRVRSEGRVLAALLQSREPELAAKVKAYFNSLPEFPAELRQRIETATKK